jgi:hypothetical protein
MDKKQKRPRKLSPQREKFVEELAANGGNATKAAKEAGYSAESAKTMGSRLLQSPEVRKRIRERALEAAGVTADEVIGVLASHMRGDITDLLDEGGCFDLAHVRKYGLGHLIKAITIRRETCSHPSHKGQRHAEVLRIELHNSQTASVHLSKVMGIEMPGAEELREMVNKARVYLSTVKLIHDRLAALAGVEQIISKEQMLECAVTAFGSHVRPYIVQELGEIG